MLPILPNPWESAGLPDEEVPAEQPRTAQFLAPEGFRLGDLATPVLYLGQRARTANLPALKEAQEMETAGRDRKDIWSVAGWGRQKDGSWEWELSDNRATLNPEAAMNPRGTTLGELLNHSELFDAHPDLRNIIIELGPLTDADAEYHQPTRGSPEKIVISDALRGRAVLSRLLHEVQHAIQYREGFAPGSSEQWMQREIYGPGRVPPDWPRDAFTAYLNSLGEVKARDVEARMDWSPEQRRAWPPWETERPTRDLQIVPPLIGFEPALPDIPLPRPRPRASDIPIPRPRPPIFFP